MALVWQCVALTQVYDEEYFHIICEFNQTAFYGNIFLIMEILLLILEIYLKIWKYVVYLQKIIRKHGNRKFQYNPSSL